MSAATSSQAENPAPPSPQSVLFARGVIARLAIWPALRVAVDNGWGGPESAEKRTWMASVIVDAFEEQVPAPDAEYVEEQLLQIMSDEFETELEDDSAMDVARDVVRMWAETHAGDSTSVLKFESHADRFKGKKVEVEVTPADGEEDWEDDSDEEGEDDGEDAPELMETSARPSKPEPEIDEDGFTMVKGKGKSHR
ncbi:hypothetical protein EIP86_001750 [Pleurotus ostreatoroseus]|nr:hypothetical protein EIP86_001750 [Pleurotus ostreatoroseus]